MTITAKHQIPTREGTPPSAIRVSTSERKSMRAALLAEFLGTAGLLCTIIGSGIMAERLAGGNVAVALLANTLATVFGLYVLIEMFGPISGAHFNPAVTLGLAWRGLFKPPVKSGIALYLFAQVTGAIAGAWLAHAMFDLKILQVSSAAHDGWGLLLGEFVATAGLMLVILKAPAGRCSAMVACYIGAAYWFTSSMSYANPAAVVARAMTNTFDGIAPGSGPGFVIAELLGTFAACLVASLLVVPEKMSQAQRVEVTQAVEG